MFEYNCLQKQKYQHIAFLNYLNLSTIRFFYYVGFLVSDLLLLTIQIPFSHVALYQVRGS